MFKGKADLGRTIYNLCSIEGKFKDKSGNLTNKYFDKYLFMSNPKIIGEICRQFAFTLQGKRLLTRNTVLAGMEIGGIPLATQLSYQTNLPLTIVRKLPKTVGKEKLIEGVNVKGKIVILVKDIIDSGNSYNAAVEAVKNEGGVVGLILTAIDTEKRVSDLKVPLFSLFSMRELEKFK